MEFSSKKNLILLILICTIFALIIIKAYDYLPDKSVENNNIMINSKAQTENSTNNYQNYTDNNVQQQEQNYDPERHKSGHIDYMHSENTNKYEEISAPKGTYEENITLQDNDSSSKLSPDELAIQSIFKAMKYKTASDYSEAINELQKVSEYTSDKEILATSYEKIAEIYAIQKRYSTALSFAGKAYSSSPSINREMLIARIYYQSGQTESAVSSLNNILSRGFRD